MYTMYNCTPPRSSCHRGANGVQCNVQLYAAVGRRTRHIAFRSSPVQSSPVQSIAFFGGVLDSVTSTAHDTFHSIPVQSIPFQSSPVHSIPVQYGTVRYSTLRHLDGVRRRGRDVRDRRAERVRVLCRGDEEWKGMEWEWNGVEWNENGTERNGI